MNPLTLLLVLVLATGGAAGACGVLRALRGRTGTVSASRLSKTGSADLLRMLENIEKADEPPPVIGAMCYEPVALPPVTEYLCPVCGEKSVYDSAWDDWALLSIDEARSVFASIDSLTDYDLRLDETDLCSTCSADGDSVHTLYLEVTHPGGTVHRSAVTVEDLRVLEGFFAGSLDYPTSNDGTLPLKPQLGRIREILGLEDR